MLFNSFQYQFFLLAVFLLFFCLPYQIRIYFLWGISILFAFLWGWQTGIFLLLESTTAYLIALYLNREVETKKRKIATGIAVVLLLAGLVWFKYANFFIDSYSVIRNLFGSYHASKLKIILPIGISFYSFMCLGYVIDVYRKKISAEKNWFHFSAFAGFFPQFASGPIGNADDLLPQLKQKQHCCPENLEIGFRLILWGLFKKIVIADRLATFANPVFDYPENYNGFTAWIAMYFFAVQIYCDFSGYSDIAIGSAKMFGINLMQNFKQPYFADSIYEFWKRWHISLTSWFRNYLYISLGGNRVSYWRWQLNIFLVFLVSGLWHGAAWTFVIWGGIHGVVYLLEQWSRKVMERFLPKFNLPGIRILKMIIIFHIVSFAWVFFRASSFESAMKFFSRIYSHWGVFQWGATKIPTFISFALIVFLIVCEILIACGWSGDYIKKGRCPGWLRCIGYSCLLIGLALLAVSSSSFIYLQF